MPMRVLLFGGHGKVALLLEPLLAARGDTVTAVIRNAAHEAEVAATGAHPVVFDVEAFDIDHLTDLIAGNDVVVWSAGAGGIAPIAPTRSTETPRSVRWTRPPRRACAIRDGVVLRRRARPRRAGGQLLLRLRRGEGRRRRAPARQRPRLDVWHRAASPSTSPRAASTSTRRCRIGVAGRCRRGDRSRDPGCLSDLRPHDPLRPRRYPDRRSVRGMSRDHAHAAVATRRRSTRRRDRPRVISASGIDRQDESTKATTPPRLPSAAATR